MPAISAGPVSCRVPSAWCVMAAPMRVRMVRHWSPTWVVEVGQCGMRTVPPVTMAAARKGPALDRSGSMVRSKAAIGPGSTFQLRSSGRVITTPSSRSVATVISMWSGLAMRPWAAVISRPLAVRAATSSRALMNCEEPEASTVIRPPARDPVPVTVAGSRPGSPCPLTGTLRSDSAPSTGAMGRSRACGSPSKVKEPRARAASGGTKRMTVPASPQSMSTRPISAPRSMGVMCS